MEFRKRLWLLYLLVIGLEIVLTMLVAYVQHQSSKNASKWRRTAICFGSFLQTSVCGVNLPLWALAYTWKKLHEFFITYLECVITRISKSQKISACYVKYVLCLFKKKTMQNG